MAGGKNGSRKKPPGLLPLSLHLESQQNECQQPLHKMTMWKSIDIMERSKDLVPEMPHLNPNSPAY